MAEPIKTTGETLTSKTAKVRKFPIKQAGAIFVKNIRAAMNFKTLPNYIKQETLEANKVERVYVQDTIYPGQKGQATFVNVRDIFKWQDFGTKTHRVPPRFAKALHWGGKPGFFSKGHDVLGITALNFWEKGYEKSLPELNTFVGNFISGVFAHA